METIKDMIDKQMSIADINKATHQYINSINNHPDKLRSAFILLSVLQEASSILTSIDFNDFSKQMIERINSIEKEVKSTSDAFNGHLHENDLILSVLTNNDEQATALKRQIKDLLSSYDEIIDHLVAERKRLALYEVPV